MGPMRYYRPPPSAVENKETDTKDEKYGDLTPEELFQARGRFVFTEPAVFEPVSREDIVGVDHILKTLDRYIKLIKNFEKLEKYNAKLDVGLIFSGEPGSGKTYAARYVATRSEARFIDVSEFPRQKGRFSTDDIKQLFGLLKQYVADSKKPIIVFWDEFEIFADVGDDSERKDALARFKTEISGIGGNLKGVFIIVATNRAHLIPADIRRPGRLGKTIFFGPFKRRAKKKFLEHVVGKFDHGPDIDYDSLSFLTDASYPAEIEEMADEAWRNTIMETLDTDKKASFTNDLLVETFIKEARGLPMDIRLTDDELHGLAVYEVGRAIVARTLNFSCQLIALQRDGYPDTYRISFEEHYSAHMPLDRICDQVAVSYGGIIAEELCGIKPNSKQIDDYFAATVYAQQYAEYYRATQMASELSMGALVKARSTQGLPSSVGLAENTMHATLDGIKKILTQQQERVRGILSHYGTDVIESAAKKLIEKGFFLQADVDKILDPTFKPSGELKPTKKFSVGYLDK